ncbi:hypothetical protein CCACVL1_09091 [Corchorus capsularis]|uniref:Uncharacterized protein n=1 Tax=Corchorus capsularis TaxID=210143 RepID=A0A1R3IXR8_COCAP|nr:hypothetical protein CCACVL1_09091 [Corchorus capsularis]
MDITAGDVWGSFTECGMQAAGGPLTSVALISPPRNLVANGADALHRKQAI